MELLGHRVIVCLLLLETTKLFYKIVVQTYTLLSNVLNSNSSKFLHEHFLFFQFYFFNHTVWHVGSQFPDQGQNLYPLHWKHGVLTSGPPGKSPTLSSLTLQNSTLGIIMIHILRVENQDTEKQLIFITSHSFSNFCYSNGP